ncbi:right-handed parallel beta-helix repeat-containing protein [Rhizobium mongolense]|uniref:right-handed parallel beta-helix repeat-containing protein n=1 Tax=Rhizobium mongolense TaxID=57676 RepID=UPI0035587F35
MLSGKSGTQREPIVLRGQSAVIGPGTPFETYRREGNRLAAQPAATGQFPGLYYLADNASLIVRNCQWVIIEDLDFDGCWPTSIYLDNCQNVVIRRVDFRGGTFAIGAAGPYTRHLLVEDCSWIQDTSGKGAVDFASICDKGAPDPAPPPASTMLWSKTNWIQVHGSPKDGDPPVDIDNDARAFDGDFFRAWTIAGYVVIRRNVIIDAFNAVHFFNEASPEMVDRHSKNVLIENNWFVRIRDNAVEPENFAWNWTIRHNRFVDCYVPFSFEMARSGHFYVYGNLGWNANIPGPSGDDHVRGQLFKFPDAHTADGPHYVFNNTWSTNMAVAKKKRFSQLFHFNNAIALREPDGKPLADPPNVFGSGWQSPDDPRLIGETFVMSEQKRFTKQWAQLRIQFDGDVIEHPNFPDAYRQSGYDLGPNSRSGVLLLEGCVSGKPEDLKLIAAPRAVVSDIKLPAGRSIPSGNEETVIGAWQGEQLISLPTAPFEELWPIDSELAAAEFRSEGI